MVERHVASAEQHIVDGELHVVRQREIVGRLEAVGLGGSQTARIARDLLRQMEANLKSSVTERNRLRTMLRK